MIGRIEGFLTGLHLFPAQCRPDASTSVLERTMPNATFVGAVEPLEAPDGKAMSAARERRESEIVITDWEEEARRLGRALALMTLDLSAMTGPKWAHRFVISVGPVAEAGSGGRNLAHRDAGRLGEGLCRSRRARGDLPPLGEEACVTASTGS
jgi:hypothetical protein